MGCKKHKQYLMQTWTQKRMQIWMQQWKKMWVAMIGIRYGTNNSTKKVDVIIETKKYANLDARQDAIRDVKVDANTGAT